MARTLAFLAALVALALPGPVAAAQDATPAASPAAIACVHPELPPGTPTPPQAAATPPAADQTATPAGDGAPAPATPDPDEGIPADQATVDRVLAFEQTVFACFNSGDFLGAAALYTPEALRENLGIDNPYDLPALMAGEPPIELIRIEDVRVLPDGRLRYEDFYRIGDEVYHDLNYLVEQGGFLLLAKSVRLAVEPADLATPAA